MNNATAAIVGWLNGMETKVRVVDSGHSAILGWLPRTLHVCRWQWLSSETPDISSTRSVTTSAQSF